MSVEKDMNENVKVKLQKKLRFVENWMTATDFDTTIICEDGNCRAHKLVLASASPLLSAALDDQFPGEETCYTIPDIKKETMDLLIRLAYTGQIICNSQQLEIVKDAMKFLGFIQLRYCTITETQERQNEIEINQNIPVNEDNGQVESINQKFKDNETNKISEQNDKSNDKISLVTEAQNNDENKTYNQNKTDENNQGNKDKTNSNDSQSVSSKFSSYDSFDEAIRNNDFDESVERSLMGIVDGEVTSNPSQNTTTITTTMNNLDSSGNLNNAKASFSGGKSKKESQGKSSNSSRNKKRVSQKSKDGSQKTNTNLLSRKRNCKSDNSQSSSSPLLSKTTVTDSQKDDNNPVGKPRLSRTNSPLKKTNERMVKSSNTIKSSPRLQAKASKNTLSGTTSTAISSDSTAAATTTTTTTIDDSANDINSNNTKSISMDKNDSPIMEGFEELLDEEALRWLDSVEKSNTLAPNEPHSKVNSNNVNLKLDEKVAKKDPSNDDELEEKLNQDQSKNNEQGMSNDTTASPMKETSNHNAVTSEKENDIEVKSNSQEKRTATKRASLRPASRKRSASPSTSTDSNTGVEAPESKKLRQTRKSKIEKETPTRISLRLNKTKND